MFEPLPLTAPVAKALVIVPLLLPARMPVLPWVPTAFVTFELISPISRTVPPELTKVKKPSKSFEVASSIFRLLTELPSPSNVPDNVVGIGEAV